MLRILLVLVLVLGACVPSDDDSGLSHGSYGAIVGGVMLSSPTECLAEGQDFPVTVAWVRSGPNILPFDTINVALGHRDPTTNLFVQPVSNHRTTGTSFTQTFKCPAPGQTAYIKGCVRVIRPGQPASPDRCAFLDKKTGYGPPDPVDSVIISASGIVGPEYSFPAGSSSVMWAGYPDWKKDRVGACERWLAAFPDSSPWIDGKVNEQAIPQCVYAWYQVINGDTVRHRNNVIGQFCACYLVNNKVVVGQPVSRGADEYCKTKCEELFA